MALEVASRAMKDYGARYTPFPYTEFDIVSTPTLALGIEYPGMIAITSRIYDIDSELRGTPTRIYMEATVAHETGHQWFYSLVGDDQLDDRAPDVAHRKLVVEQPNERADRAGCIIVLGLAEQQRAAPFEVAQVHVVAERRTADFAVAVHCKHDFRLRIVPAGI